MKIIKLNEQPIKKTPHNMKIKSLYDHDTAQIIHIELKSGEGLKPHITPVDVCFYILEGTPEILIGNEKQIVEANCLVESPKDIIHSIFNTSDSIAKILVIKAPKPTTKTKLL